MDLDKIDPNTPLPPAVSYAELLDQIEREMTEPWPAAKAITERELAYRQGYYDAYRQAYTDLLRLVRQRGLAIAAAHDTAERFHHDVLHPWRRRVDTSLPPRLNIQTAEPPHDPDDEGEDADATDA